MYKKLWFGTIALLFVLLVVFLWPFPTFAQPPSYSYQIQVVQNGEPVMDAYVRVAGVGVEMTDSQGMAIFDMSDAFGRGGGRQQLYRGPNYAAKKGKLHGSVSDEYDLFSVQISSHDIGETRVQGWWETFPSPGPVDPENPEFGMLPPPDPIWHPGEPAFAYGTWVYLKLNTLYQIEL